MIYPWLGPQWERFKLQYNQQRTPHALILTGQAGLGQRALADQMAVTVLCQHTDNNEPCGQCHSCQLFLSGNHPDHSVITPEENGKAIKIDQIRQLKDKQMLTASVSAWKTAIIEPAEAMNINASNSLLKLLEEPQANTLLILISERVEQLAVTILSRCQKLPLSVPTTEQADQWLANQVDASQDKRALALQAANGGPLRALSLLTESGLEEIEQIKTDFAALLAGRSNPIQLAQKWHDFDLKQALNYLQISLQTRLSEDKKSNVRSSRDYWHIYDCINDTLRLLSSPNNVNKALLIEQFMVSVMDLPTPKSNA